MARSQVSAITVEWVEQWLVGRGQGVPPHAVLHWRGDAARLAKDLVAAGVDVAVLRKALAHDA